MIKYIDKAKLFYENDELGNSRMIMTCIKLVCLLDKIAINQFPMLTEHKIGIDSKTFESLLIINSTGLMHCKSLIKYIESRNNTDTPYDSLVDMSKINKDTFSVRFAYNDKNAQNIMQDILRDAEEKKTQKLIELENQRRIYSGLMGEYNELNCNCEYEEYGSLKIKCKKCTIFTKAKSMKLTVYEWPLPEDLNLQRAVVFELCIPKSICYLRDALHVFRTKIIGMQNDCNNKLHGTWIKYEEISKYALKIDRLVTLGSSNKLFTQSHYSELSPDTYPDSKFLVPNGYSVSYCDFKTVFSYNGKRTYEDLCTLKCEKPYDILQWAIAGTIHTENRVLAEQSTCPKNFSLNEFIKYGSFRAGHRLQMRNLLDAIETRGLSFKHRAVYSLIAQSIWQVGPINDCFELNSNNYYPSSHLDFNEPTYLIKLHCILSNWLKLSTKCWNDHLVLLVIVIIISRGISLAPNDESRTLFVDLIFKCRSVLVNWLEVIQNNLLATNIDEETKSMYNLKLFEISCFIILSYDTDQKYQNGILYSKKHIFLWLKAMCLIYEKKFITEGNLFQRNLYRRVTICLLDMEAHLNNTIQALDKEEPLTDFITQYWSDSYQGKFIEWKNANNSLLYHSFFISNDDKKK